MNDNQYKSNPCCNRLLKFKIKLKDINIKKLEIDNNNYNSCNKNNFNLNDFFSPQRTPQEETSNRITKVSNPFTSASNRRFDQKQLQQQQQLSQKEFILHEFRKPNRYFSVNINQFNIENKINHNNQYQPISSFELKLTKELQRLSQAYRKDDIRKLFYKNKTLTSLHQLKPKFEMYRDVKWIENRFSGRKFKAKLLPISYKSKDNMNKLAKRFYNHSCYLLQNKPHLNE